MIFLFYFIDNLIILIFQSNKLLRYLFGFNLFLLCLTSHLFNLSFKLFNLPFTLTKFILKITNFYFILIRLLFHLHHKFIKILICWWFFVHLFYFDSFILREQIIIIILYTFCHYRYLFTGIICLSYLTLLNPFTNCLKHKFKSIIKPFKHHMNIFLHIIIWR